MNNKLQTLVQIAQLLNSNEYSEALKELRKMHGLVNKFVCQKCGSIQNELTAQGCVQCKCSPHYVAMQVVLESDTGLYHCTTTDAEHRVNECPKRELLICRNTGNVCPFYRWE